MAKPGCYPPPSLDIAYPPGTGVDPNCAYASMIADTMYYWSYWFQVYILDVDDNLWDHKRAITRFLYQSKIAANTFPKLLNFLATGTNFADFQALSLDPYHFSNPLAPMMMCAGFNAVVADAGVFNPATFAAELTTAGYPVLGALALAYPLAEWNRVIMQYTSDILPDDLTQVTTGDCSECE